MLDKFISLIIGVFLWIIIMYCYNTFFQNKPDFQNTKQQFENSTWSWSFREQRAKRSQNLDSN